MRVSAIQLADPGGSAETLAALTAAVTEAIAAGAVLVVCPCMPTLDESPATIAATRAAVRDVADGATVILPCSGLACGAPVDNEHAIIEGPGSVAVLCGDDCIDPDSLASVAVGDPDVLVLQVAGENELQAEAIREFAIATSETVAGLVLVASRTGAEDAAGGALIAYGGETLAEAGEGTEVLLADVITPVLPPEMPGVVPTAPTILLQRLAVHQGRSLEVDFLADND
jgi:predicted amidohydrolase